MNNHIIVKRLEDTRENLIKNLNKMQFGYSYDTNEVIFKNSNGKIQKFKPTKEFLESMNQVSTMSKVEEEKVKKSKFDFIKEN